MAEEFGVKVKLIPEFDSNALKTAASAAAGKNGVKVNLLPVIDTKGLQSAVNAAAKNLVLNIDDVKINGKSGRGSGASSGGSGSSGSKRSFATNIEPLIKYYKNLVDYIRKNPSVQNNKTLSSDLSNEKKVLAGLVRSAIQTGSYNKNEFTNSKNKVAAIQNAARTRSLEDTSTSNKTVAALQKQVDAIREKAVKYSTSADTTRVEAELKKAEGAIHQLSQLGTVSAESFGKVESSAKAAIASAKGAMDSLSASVKDTSNDLVPVYNLLKKISSMDQPKKLSLLDDADINDLKSYKDQLEAIVEAGSYSKSDLRKITSGVAGIDYKQNNISTGFKSEVLSIAQGVTVAEAIQGAFYKAKQVATEMVTAVRDINDALTQLTIVTGKSGSELDSFFQRAADSAYDMGHSVTEVLGSVETFTRLGYGLEDASTLADAATVMSNVADTTVDASTTGLTSIIKGYGLEASDATRVSDVLAKVGKDYAISAEELMSALERGGAALNVANTSFEQSVALAAAGNAAIQDPIKTGTALKTMSARIRTSKPELEELGEDYDDVATSAAKYRAEIKALSGVDIMENATTYKSIYDIMVEIASVWDKMPDTDQAALLERIAGKNQSNVVAGIITNLKDLTGAYDEALSASGETEAANEVVMDSISGKVGQFKEQFEELSYNTINSDLVKGVVSGGTGILGFLNKAIELFHQLGPAATGVETILAGIAGVKLFKGGADILKQLATGAAKDSFSGIVAGKTLDSVNKAKSAISGLWGVISAHPVAAAATAVGALAAAFGVAAMKAESLGGKIEQFKADSEAYKSAQNNVDNVRTQIEANQKIIDNIRSQGYVNLTDEGTVAKLQREDEELERTLILKQEIANQQKATLYSDSVNALTTESNVIDFVKGDGLYQGTLPEQLRQATKAYEDTIKVKEKYESDLADPGLDSYGREQIEGKLEGVNEALDVTSETISEKYAAIFDIISNFEPKTAYDKQLVADAEKALNETTQMFDRTAGKTIPEIIGEGFSSGGALESLVDEFYNLGDAGDVTSQSIQALANEFPELNTFMQAHGITIQDLCNYYNNLTEATDRALSSEEQYGYVLQDVISFGKNMQNYQNMPKSYSPYDETVKAYDNVMQYQKTGMTGLGNDMYWGFMKENFAGFDDVNINNIAEKRKEAQKLLKEFDSVYRNRDADGNLTASGVQAFFDKMSSDKDVQSVLQKYGDSFTKDENGNYDWNIPVSHFKEVAEAIGLSTDGFESLLAAAGNYIDIDWSDDAGMTYLERIAKYSQQLGTSMQDGSKYTVASYEAVAKAAEVAGMSVEDFAKKYQESYNKILYTDIGGGYLQVDESAVKSAAKSENKSVNDYIAQVEKDSGKKIVLSVGVDTIDAETGIGTFVSDETGKVIFVSPEVEPGAVERIRKEFEGQNVTVQVRTETGSGKIYAPSSDTSKQGDGSKENTVNTKVTVTGAEEATQKVHNYNSAIDTASRKPNVTKTITTNYVENHTVNTIRKTAGPSTGNSNRYNGASTSINRAKYYMGASQRLRSNGSKANGTAFAQGTSGFWGAGGSGTALGGEVGPELLVRDGSFYVIGQDGAEFFDYRSHDIIFNAAQTEELFKKGQLRGSDTRGKTAMADGTAFAGSTTGGKKNFGNPNPGVRGNSSLKSRGSSSKSNSNKKNKKKSSSKKKSSGKKKGSGSKSDAEFFDWVEVKLQRIEEAIELVKVTADSAYQQVGARNDALRKNIKNLNSEIVTQGKAYNYYIKKANSVGLSKAYKKKVQNGAIDIDKISNKKLKEKISQYQEWYNKAQDCKKQVAELKVTVADAYKEIFDNYSTKAQNTIDRAKDYQEAFQASIDFYEEAGYKASSKYYDALIKYEAKNQNRLVAKRTGLVKKLNEAVDSGSVKIGSEAWYDMRHEIDQLTTSIIEADEALAKYKNELRQLDWDKFDDMQDGFSKLTDEADFLIDLMSEKDLFDDNGAITNEGIATKALHAQNYDVYMAQADQYAKAIAEINKSIANDPYNTKLLERREDLIESHRDAILAANDEKDALKDLAEDGFDALLDSLKDTIDEYEKALDSAKDLYDYQKNIDEQVKNISKLEKQLSAYSGDTSEESKKTVQQLKNDLKEAKDDLQDTQYDKYVSDTKELLDDLVDNFEEFINERLDDIDKLLSDAIESANKNAETVADTITSATEDVGATLSDSMKTIWSENSSKDVLANYSDSFSEECTALNGILNEIKEYVARLYSNGDSDAAGDVKDVESQTDEGKGTPKSNAGGGSTTTTKTPTDDKKMDGIFYKKKYTGNKKKLKPNKYFIHRLKYKDYDWSMKARNEYFKKMGFEKKYGKKYEKIGGKYNKQLIAWMKKRGYASGVHGVPRDEFAWTQENGPETIIRKSDGALLTQLKRGDSVLNRDATSNIWDMANNPRNFIARAMNFGVNWPVAKVPGNTGGDIKNSIDMEIVLPNVSNYNDFMNSARSDPKFEKLVQAMTVDRLAGRNTKGKNSIKW